MERPDAIVKVTIVYVIVTAIYACFAIGQFCAMRGQLAAMRKQSTIARRQTFTAERQLRTMKQQADAAGLQLAAMREQADQATELARPWLVVSPAAPPEGWPPDNARAITTPPDGVWVTWSALNVGKTPALLTRLVVVSAVVDIPDGAERPTYPEHPPFSEMPIPPTVAHSDIARWRPTDTEMVSLMNGAKCLFLYGALTYRDGLKREHRTRFCFYWRVKHPGWPGLTFSPVGPPAFIEYS